MDAVAAQARVSATVDGNAGYTLAGDITIVQFQPPLHEVYAVPIPVAHLLQCQVTLPLVVWNNRAFLPAVCTTISPGSPSPMIPSSLQMMRARLSG